jgi:hypothetical protein
MHANCVSYERMYSTGSGTYANVSTTTYSSGPEVTNNYLWVDRFQQLMKRVILVKRTIDDYCYDLLSRLIITMN